MKILKQVALGGIIFILIYGVYYAWQAFPIITGYSAKMMCSCVMLAERSPKSVTNDELNRFPLSLGSVTVNFEDSSAMAKVWGMASRKAIYRKGLGCTLVNEITESQLRAQTPHTITPPTIDQDTIPWPTGDLLPDSSLANYDLEKLKKIINRAFEEPGEKPNRRTRAILVIHDGHLIAEQYAKGFDRHSLFLGWSMTKSIINALYGIMVKNHQLDIYQAPDIASWKQDERKVITINHLLHANSGLDWEENYGGPSKATAMLFKEKDAGLYALQNPLISPPESKWYYSSGTTNILSWILRQSLGDENYYQLPYQELFYKLGMYSIILEPDPGGSFVGSSFSFATARDWARFGLLYYNKGKWQGQQILPNGWVDYSVIPAKGSDRQQYGAQWWLNVGEKGHPENRIYPSLPTDLFWADGFEGQNIFIIPSKKLVVVKLSMSHGNYLNDDLFLKEIIDFL